MTLSVIRSIGTLDRTGVVQDALARIDAERFDELDVVRPGDLDECEVDVDVLLVGSKELTATGLRRIARWRRDHPVSVAIAHLNGSAMDKSELSGGGIAQAVRGPLTVSKLRTALHRADRDVLRAALEQLPMEFREVLILRELEGLSYKEISEVAAVPIGTVMSRLARARKQLQDYLAQKGES